MQCPVDNATLVMSERSGIEIDYCPTCRGVWLDRGELDKIIERSAAAPAATPAAPPVAPGAYPAAYPPAGYPVNRPNRGGHHDRGYGEHGGQYGSNDNRRRRGWLGELFD